MSDLNREVGLAHLRDARSNFTSARLAQSAGDDTAEAFARRALHFYWTAMNRLEEEEDLFEVAHREMHEAGRHTREHFASGCELPVSEDGGFVQRCPVPLAHKRFGVSMGFTGNAICTICGGDASECPHMPGRSYESEASIVEGRCSICSEMRCQKHEVGSSYDTEAGVLVTEADLHEVSIVARPFQPDARITEIPIARDVLERKLGTLPEGIAITCDNCLLECTGFDYLTELD